MLKKYKDKLILKRKLNFNDKLLKLSSLLNQQKLLQQFQKKEFGIKNHELEKLYKKYGYNYIQTNKFNWWLNCLTAFLGPFNLLLLMICIYNFYSYFSTIFDNRYIGDLISACIVIFMIISSGAVTYLQNIKTHFVTKKLIKIISNTATVIRNINNYQQINNNNMFDLIKKSTEINVQELVPGDLIYLSSGDMVPADLRILVSRDLFVNQSSLTGESIPYEKHATTNNHNLLDLENICLMGTNIISGSAICFVVQTSKNTYFSSIADTLKDKKPLTNFQLGVKRVTLLLIIFVLIMAPIIYLLYSGTKNDWLGGISWSAAAIIGIIPEMLPMIVTSNLARGAYKLSKNKIVVKNLSSIQDLGAIDILCTDKTGTLTNDKIELVEFLTMDHKKDNTLLKLFYLNSYFQTGIKNPLDNAILNYINQKNYIFDHHKFQKIDEIPFDFNRRRLTIVIKTNNKIQLICKGAVEEILKISNKIFYNQKIIDFTNDLKKQIKNKIEKLNNCGLRVLTLAYKNIHNDKNKYNENDENELIFYGYISFLDIPKPSANKMVQILNNNGIKLKILTGDNENVTTSICKYVNMKITGIISGKQLDNLADYELKNTVEENNVFVKLNPLQKVRIIDILKANDHVVGYMGDGINDTPVLRQSNIAISVNNATDIAKEASDIIILEKSLDVLQKGIEEGRSIFGNILKYIKITIASQFGNVFTLFIVAAWIPFTPMLPIQMLFQNLIYDFSQFTITFDRVDNYFLKKPQRWRTEGMLSFALINGPISSIFDIITFIIFGYGFQIFELYNKYPNAINTIHNIAIFQSGWFIEGLTTQIIVIHMFRTKKIPFIQSNATWPVNVTTILVIIISFLIPYFFYNIFNMAAPPLIYIPIIIGIIFAYCLTAQFSKVIYIKLTKNWL